MLQATEVWVVTGLVIVQGQSVMVRVVACRMVSHMSTILFSGLEGGAAQVGWKFRMSEKTVSRSSCDICSLFPLPHHPKRSTRVRPCPFRRKRTEETV